MFDSYVMQALFSLEKAAPKPHWVEDDLETAANEEVGTDKSGPKKVLASMSTVPAAAGIAAAYYVIDTLSSLV